SSAVARQSFCDQAGLAGQSQMIAMASISTRAEAEASAALACTYRKAAANRDDSRTLERNSASLHSTAGPLLKAAVAPGSSSSPCPDCGPFPARLRPARE